MNKEEVRKSYMIITEYPDGKTRGIHNVHEIEIVDSVMNKTAKAIFEDLDKLITAKGTNELLVYEISPYLYEELKKKWCSDV